MQGSETHNREQNSKLNVNFILLKCLFLWMKRGVIGDAMRKFGYSLKGTYAYHVMEYTSSTVRVSLIDRWKGLWSGMDGKCTQNS